MWGGIRRKLNLVSDFFNKIAEYLTTVLTIVFTIITIMQVFTRYVLEISLPWPEEVARYSLVWVAFVTASILVKESGHVAVEFFKEKITVEKAKHLLMIVVYLLVSVFLVYLIVYGIAQCKVSIGQKWASIPSLSIFWVYLACPVGGGLMLVQSLKILLDEVVLAFGRNDR